MLKVLPIQDKDEQKRRCLECSVPYLADDMAYGAENDGVFGGVCQFHFLSDRGYIDCLAGNTDDFTQLFVLCRAAMNFIDLCGIHLCEASPDAAPESLLLSVGFKKQPNGSFFADMTHFFEGCKSCK